MTHSFNYSPSVNYTKTLATLEESLRTGQFARYSQNKKLEIWDRLCRYASQLGIKIKASIVAACLAAGLSMPASTEAQISFAVQSGAANPLNSVNITNARPAFVDIDGDGDKDVFIGSYNNNISYYKNTGTAVAPVFAQQTGVSNPLNGVSVSGGFSSPAFADIDGDGDQDVFIGYYYGTVLYYKNTGSAVAPVFTQQTGAANPLNGVSLGYFSAPAFVDIDGDGDKDAFVGAPDGTTTYYKNTGTSTAPTFTLQGGAANPFNGVDVGDWATPSFIDVDKNGTMDAFIGANDGNIYYYKNTGTASAPVFTAQTGAANPFNGVNVGFVSAPAAVDIDGDTKTDIFIGSNAGSISYYKNTSTVLPLQLLGFTGSYHPGYHQLQWQTADEVNTQQFELESNNNGAGFTTIATIKAAGGGNNSYSYQDKTAYSSKVFYRLKMMDLDGRFTYSKVIWINSRQTGGVSLYPNPARALVNINIGESGMINTTAFLYSYNGRLLQKFLITAEQQQINVQGLAKGEYILKFANGTVSGFIKE
jgi:hypothetical protein